MTMRIKTLAAVAAGAVLATNAFAQSTKEVRGASPYVAIENEPPPKLVVDPTPLAAGLAHDIVWIQYRVENVHIVPVFGAGALNVSPRIGHLHIHVTAEAAICCNLALLGSLTMSGFAPLLADKRTSNAPKSERPDL
jgi:hypothetical protein